MFLSGKALLIFFVISFLVIIFTIPVECSQDRPRVGYEYWIPNSTTDMADQHGIHFKRFVNGSAYLPRYPFSFQRRDDPQLAMLNRRMGIDSLVADATSEFESAVRIAHKISELWAHQWPIEYPVWNALGILDQTGQGDHLWCTYKHLLLLQCLATIGIHSRIIPCNWHHALEFWSNEHAKWVIMDAWTASYYRRDGMPLGALELHGLSRATGNLAGSGVWEININPDRWQPERKQDSVLAETSCYSHLRYIPRNDFLSAPLAPKPAGAPGSYLQPNNQINDLLQTGLEHIIWWQPGDAPPIVGPFVRYRQDFNFPLNEVEVDLRRPVTHEGVLDVSLDTHTPEFDSFYRRIDHGEWTGCGSSFLWELEPGANSVEFKSRNKWGRFGPLSVIELDYRPEELKSPVVDKLEIPNPGFESADGTIEEKVGLTAETWLLVVNDVFQKPAFYGVVKEGPHSGGNCFKITVNENGVWAKLASGKFRANQASDVSLRLWLRADRPESKVVVFIKDVTAGGPGSESVIQQRFNAGEGWSEFVLKGRLTARTSELMVGVQVTEGTVWVDDFSISEDSRAELPW
jgi:hypothetical protein